jgi:FtsZ-interacting cell division protein ZipA
MKKYTNLVLLSLLAALLYKTPQFLIESVSSQMGKLAWVSIIAISNYMLDSVAAIILAVIMITLLHQSTVEGFEGKEGKEKKSKKEKTKEKEIEEMETMEKEKEDADKEMETDDETEDEEEDNESKENEEEDDETGKEGFEVLSSTKKKCTKYNKEGFSGFTELLKKLKIPVTNTNTTDLDREIKASAERSTLKSTMEYA